MGHPLHQTVSGLIDERLAAGETVYFRVTSGSMSPLLQTGDVVGVERTAPETCRIGDIIVIRREHDYLTHRLIHKSGEFWQTKGDNVLRPDSPIRPNSVLGRVTRVRKSGGTWNLQTARQRQIALLLAKLSRREWQVYNIARFLRLPFRLAIRALQWTTVTVRTERKYRRNQGNGNSEQDLHP
jgi:signal peptidase I